MLHKIMETMGLYAVEKSPPAYDPNLQTTSLGMM